MRTIKVMWLMEENAIKDLWSDWSRQKIALRNLPIKRKKRIKFSNKGEKKILKR